MQCQRTSRSVHSGIMPSAPSVMLLLHLKLHWGFTLQDSRQLVVYGETEDAIMRHNQWLEMNAGTTLEDEAQRQRLLATANQTQATENDDPARGTDHLSFFCV